jgi:uncharacterized membrane protein (DUF2068 family)
MGNSNHSHKLGLRTIAVVEASKGVGVSVLCLLLLSLLGKDFNVLAFRLTDFLRLNPDSRLADWCYELANRITGRGIWIAFFVGCIYVSCRFVEAYGLWNQRRWGEWLAVITGGIYLPLEIYAVIRNANWVNLLVLAGNLFVVLYILGIMLESRRRRLAMQRAEAEESGALSGREKTPWLRAAGACDVKRGNVGLKAGCEADD